MAAASVYTSLRPGKIIAQSRTSYMGKKDGYEYLEEERQKLWAEVVSQRSQIKEIATNLTLANKTIEALIKEVEKKTSDYEKEAKNAAAQTTRHKNRALETLQQIENSANKIEQLASRTQELENKFSEIHDFFSNAQKRKEDFERLYHDLTETQTALATKETELSEALSLAGENLDISLEQTEKIEGLKNTSESLHAKISSTHAQVAKKLQEISSHYDSVFGYKTTDEDTNEEIKIPGTRDELEDAYTSLKKNLQELGKELTGFRNEKIVEFNEFSKNKTNEFESLKHKIANLLPDAMTAGLSHAYEKKRITEEQEGKAATITFGKAIVALSSISLIPVAISVYSLIIQKEAFRDVIQHLPQVVLAIIPLYAPAFWFAISASKRIKLSKRLTEEYAHKEVLSKTFEGLSTQINNLDSTNESEELRVKLLYNIVSVSADNPGKLISDYNNSDNPIFEAIDKSLSLSKSLEKISAIPGIGAILKKLEKSREDNKEKIIRSVQGNLPEEENEAAA